MAEKMRSTILFTTVFIQQWLDDTEHDRICVAMLWKEALKHEFDDPPRKTINDLHEIMRNEIVGWKYVGRSKCGRYGVQRCYDRMQKRHIIDGIPPDDV